MFSFVKKEKESSRESCERAKRQLRGGLERAERESWDTERGTKERALRERELKRVQKRAHGRGSHIHSLLSSYVLCPPKGEAAVRLLWFSYLIFLNILFCFNLLFSQQAIYRVIFDNLHQELTCYRLVLSLLRFLKASMWPQDWAQITFRSEILSHQF